MAQTKIGAMKLAAKKVGLSFDEYLDAIECGLKRCTQCKQWRTTGEFDTDKSRWDGLTAMCVYCRRVKVRKARKLPAPSTEIQNAAVNAVRTAIRQGRLLPPKMLPCFDCAKSACDYHHHMGYERSHWLDVQPLCRSCHKRRHF